MPRLTLIAVALPALVCALLCPTIAVADSSEGLTERYIASTFRAMVDAASDAPTQEEATVALRTLIRDDMAIDATARFVLGSDWPTKNPRAAERFRQRFLHFVSAALAGALRTHRQVSLRVERSHRSDGRILVDSALVLRPGFALPLTWTVRPEGPKGRRRIENLVLAGIDARTLLREVAASALERQAGNLDAVADLFDRMAARAGGPASTASP